MHRDITTHGNGRALMTRKMLETERMQRQREDDEKVEGSQVQTANMVRLLEAEKNPMKGRSTS